MLSMLRIVATICVVEICAGSAAAEVISFSQAGKAGEVPAGFSVATTGRGAPAEWKLKEATDAPSGKLAVVQLSTGGDMRFPLLVYEKVMAKDLDLSVRFKAVSGQTDQAAGLVWRYQDHNNYYIVRANALEDNVVLYIVSAGKRVDLPVKGKGRTYGAKTPVSKSEWNLLAVSVRGDHFMVSLNGEKLYEVQDKQITKPGKVGLWTKADSVMLFDHLTIESAK